MPMKKYQYPVEVTEENFKELVKRAEKIASDSSITFGASVIISFLLVIALVLYLFPILGLAHTAIEYVGISLVIALGVAIFCVAYLIDFVNIFLRRIYQGAIPYYGSPEEFVFAQFLLTANLFTKEKSARPRFVRFRSLYLSQEISKFIKYEPLNYRRKFYAQEFRLLGRGEVQIGRMLLFSEKDIKQLLAKFALALVNDEDKKAHVLLTVLINEIEKYGKLESLTKRIENKLTSWQTIVALIGGAIAIIAKLIEMFVV